jgi:hypothetical protein
VNRVSPKIAKEIRVLLQHEHAAAGSSKEQAGHDSSGSAAGDDQVELRFVPC